MDLRIDLSEDAKTLAVREIPVGKASTDSALNAVQWCVHATAFGPNASFELSNLSVRRRVRDKIYGPDPEKVDVTLLPVKGFVNEG